MTLVAKIVSEIFMLVLAVIAAPNELKEFRLDLIQHSGRVETVVVRRTGDGFTLLEPQGDQLVAKGTIRPVAGKPAGYAIKLGDAAEQTVDIAAGIPGFSLDALQKAQSLELKANDGVSIHVQRSGTAVYLTPDKGRVTYACH